MTEHQCANMWYYWASVNASSRMRHQYGFSSLDTQTRFTEPGTHCFLGFNTVLGYNCFIFIAYNIYGIYYTHYIVVFSLYEFIWVFSLYDSFTTALRTY